MTPLPYARMNVACRCDTAYAMCGMQRRERAGDPLARVTQPAADRKTARHSCRAVVKSGRRSDARPLHVSGSYPTLSSSSLPVLPLILSTGMPILSRIVRCRLLTGVRSA